MHSLCSPFYPIGSTGTTGRRIWTRLWTYSSLNSSPAQSSWLHGATRARPGMTSGRDKQSRHQRSRLQRDWLIPLVPETPSMQHLLVPSPMECHLAGSRSIKDVNSIFHIPNILGIHWIELNWIENRVKIQSFSFLAVSEEACICKKIDRLNDSKSHPNNSVSWQLDWYHHHILGVLKLHVGSQVLRLVAKGLVVWEMCFRKNFLRSEIIDCFFMLHFQCTVRTQPNFEEFYCVLVYISSNAQFWNWFWKLARLLTK